MTGDQMWRLAASQEPSPLSWCPDCNRSWFGPEAHNDAVKHLRVTDCSQTFSLQMHRVYKVPVVDATVSNQAAAQPPSPSQSSEMILLT